MPALSFANLVKEPPKMRTYYIEGLFPHSCIWIYGGPQWIGKSFFALNIAMSLANGTRFLSKYAVPKPVRVLLIDKEVGREGLKKRLNIMNCSPDNAFALPKEEPEASGLYLDQPGTEDALSIVIEQQKINVVMLDPLNPFLMGDEGESSFSGAFRTIDRLMLDHKKLGLSIVIAHHFREVSVSRGDDPLDLRNFRSHGKLIDYPGLRTTLKRGIAINSQKELWRLKARWFPRNDAAPPDDDIIVRKDFKMEVPLVNQQGFSNL